MLFKCLILLMVLMINVNFGQEIPKIEPGVSRELAHYRAAHYENVRYKLNLTLEKQSPVLKGSMEIRVVVRQPRAVGIRDVPIILDWRKIKGKEQFSTVSNVKINGKPAVQSTDFSRLNAREIPTEVGTLNYFEINEHLVFREGLKSSENVIAFDFTSPIATSGAAMTRYIDKEDGAEYIYSLFVPSDASTAFPCFDQPDLKARFALKISAPPSWKIVSNSNGVPLSSRSEETTIEFAETSPISTYVFAFAAGDFKELVEINKNGNLTVIDDEFKSALTSPSHLLSRIYVRKSQAEKFKQHAAEVFRLNREAVKFLENYFDYKFPFPKYDLVLIPEFPFGGMEHAGATFLREDRVIFPTEPTANDFITRGNLIFHEAAHQWFGDTVTMRWFDDLWLKEGFAEFMAYKTMEKVLPQYNAWKAFYERNKPLAYLTDATGGTTPIYQEIPNLSSAKSAYGNIVYRKAPSFLKQAEFYLGEKEFQTAARAFLKQNAFKNAEWRDLIAAFEKAAGKEFETKSGTSVKEWAEAWVKQRGLPIIQVKEGDLRMYRRREDIEKYGGGLHDTAQTYWLEQTDAVGEDKIWNESFNVLMRYRDGDDEIKPVVIRQQKNHHFAMFWIATSGRAANARTPALVFPNYQDYGYGIFLLDEQSRAFVLANLQNEKDDFLRSMMWGALWDSVREAELDPKAYVELAVKNISGEKDELTIQTILSRVGTAMNYYIENGSAPSANAGSADLIARLENVLIERMTNAETLGQRITFYRAFLNIAASDAARQKLKDILNGKFAIKGFQLKTKDKFDILARLLSLGENAAPLLQELAKTERSDEARRYAYAAQAAIPTAQNKKEFFEDFVNNPAISESWIESAFAPFNAVRHSELTLPYLEKALAELPNLKRTRKIFFVNGWLSAFIGGQKDEKALAVVNKFLADNPNLDRDLRLKILENVDGLERAVRIRGKFSK